MLVEIPRAVGSERFKPGTWWRWLAHTAEPEYRPYWTATICCPECGRLLNLALHTIEANGQVVPSVGHPPGYAPCGWHTNPRLIGWEQWSVPEESALETPPPETCERCGAQSHTLGGWGTWSGGSGLICQKCFKDRAA